MMKESKLNRVNVIRNKFDDDDRMGIIQKWAPVLESAGIKRKSDGFHDSLALYCEQHALSEAARDIGLAGPNPSLGMPPAGGFQGLLTSVPTQIIPSALPVIIGLIRDMDRIKNMRIEPIEAPCFTLLIEDNQYFQEIDTIDCDFEIPAMSIQDTKTNLFEIYHDRMIEHFKNEFIKYLDSAPNADTLIVYSLGELFIINSMDGQMKPKLNIRFRFRVKALEDATYIPTLRSDVPNMGKIDDIPDIAPVDEVPDLPASTWVVRFDKEPSRFKKWIARVILGASVVKMNSSTFYKDYWM